MKSPSANAGVLMKRTLTVTAFPLYSPKLAVVLTVSLARNPAPLTKKPLDPNDDEIRRNPRARSAKLRVAVVAAAGDGGVA